MLLILKNLVISYNYNCIFEQKNDFDSIYNIYQAIVKINAYLG